MAYRRRRRMYGRRRRYSRRRPSASRATLRGRLTLAPRHQYLKLKKIYTFKDARIGIAATPDTSAVRAMLYIPLQLPGQITALGALFANLTGDGEANGWSAYEKLFQRYVVAGVKAKVTFTSVQYNWTVPLANTENYYCAVSRSAYDYDQSGLPTTFEDVVRTPYGQHQILTRDKPATFKQYINMNSLFGEVVKKHDAYVHDWDATVASDPTTKRGCLIMNVETPHAQATFQRDWFPAISVTLVYYIHALQVQPLGVAPAALMQLQAISQPGGWLGEQPNESSYVRSAQEAHHPVANSALMKAANKAVTC